MGEPAAVAEVSNGLLELTYDWADVEEAFADWDGDEMIAEALARAFRVEADEEWESETWRTTTFRLFDIRRPEDRQAAKFLRQRFGCWDAPLEKVGHVIGRPFRELTIYAEAVLPDRTQVEGAVCRRLGEDHPPWLEPTLAEVPVWKPHSDVPLIFKDAYWLTPIELPFYNALRETGLTFSVQPWIQGTDRRYRLDFLIMYGGGGVAVELDGQGSHSSPEEREHDAERDRWFQQRRIKTMRWTGREVKRDPGRCVRELLDALREVSASP